ncbi:MAG: hypothetical protein U0414_05970 [Polyangiaceae bacterium]
MTLSTRTFAITALLGALAACAPLRFQDRPIVWSVSDDRDIPEPEEREYLRYGYFADIFAFRRLERALELRTLHPAKNPNALEEVPDSTWFQNRLSVRDYTPEELARGPAGDPAPAPPFTIERGKSGGGALGFVMKDTNGRSFLVKFDRPENPEMQTGTDVVVDRIFWTFGFHVPADYVFFARREDFQIAPEAKATDALGHKVPYSPSMLDEALSAGAPPIGGVYRATASAYLDGVPKGGFSAEGIRRDDPNDRVPHEDRRELRGLRVLAAWLNHTDMKEDNTLDVFVTEKRRSFLRHYLVDFGEALGGHGAEKGRREDGYEHLVDWENQGLALLAFGFWTRPWEDLRPSPYRALGTFGMEATWDPREWREAYPYWPFAEMDATDAFWAAKIITRFTRAHLDAIVAEARFTEPGAASYLVEALTSRQRAIANAYLDALTPLDGFELEGGRLCATDVMVARGYATGGTVERADDGDVVESAPIEPTGRACVALPRADAYTVVKLRVRRGSTARPWLEVHVAEAEGGAHVLGLVRDAGGG